MRYDSTSRSAIPDTVRVLFSNDIVVIVNSSDRQLVGPVSTLQHDRVLLEYQLADRKVLSYIPFRNYDDGCDPLQISTRPTKKKKSNKK